MSNRFTLADLQRLQQKARAGRKLVPEAQGAKKVQRPHAIAPALTVGQGGYTAAVIEIEGAATCDAGSEMNKTEREYSQILDRRMAAGEILRWDFEPETFRLAPKTTYTPDFRVVRADGGVEFHEVKGAFIWEDARVKLKIAAATQPYAFLLCQLKKKVWTISKVGKQKENKSIDG